MERTKLALKANLEHRMKQTEISVEARVRQLQPTDTDEESGGVVQVERDKKLSLAKPRRGNDERAERETRRTPIDSVRLQ
jgi:hypothetical protein